MTRERRISFPAFCLTCGYHAVPGKSFNAHECVEFRLASRAARAENARASWAWMVRRLERAGVEPTPALRRMAGLPT